MTQAHLFDVTPIKIGGFALRQHGAAPLPGVSITRDGWQAAMDFANAAESASPFWVGDLLEYAQDRDDWRQMFEQMRSTTKLAEQTLHNRTTISRKVKGKAREAAPSITHAGVVTKLDPDQQLEWLERAKTEGWTVSEFQKHLRRASRAPVIAGQAKLVGKYRVVIADPPWSYGNAQPSGKRAADDYPTMSMKELCALPVESHLMDDAVMFLWVTAPMLLENPGPREVLEAWGLKPKTGMVWHKRRHNFGHYVSVRHEHVIIATRGSCLPDRPTPMPDSVFVGDPDERYEHSEKPEELRRIVTKLYDGPYLELFARKPVPGWATFGNDARLWKAS